MSLPKHHNPLSPGLSDPVGFLTEEQRIAGTYFPPAAKDPVNPLDVQVGGGHYKGKAIQPVEYISANGLNFLEGCIVKRITRWRDKNGIEDLEKIKHEVDLLIAMHMKYGHAGK